MKNNRNVITKLYTLFAAAIISLTASSQLQAQAVFLTGTSEPWQSTSLSASMDRAFGTGNWTRTTWGSINLGTVLASSTFLYIDGGADQDTPMQSFLTANNASLQTWVTNGGHLFLNSAGWNTSIVTGFSYTITYNGSSSSSVGQAVSGSPVWAGPNAVGTSYTGSSFAHDFVTGSGLTPLTTGTAGATLSYKQLGDGLLVLGGETSPQFWSGTDPIGLKANELVFAATGAAIPEPSTYAAVIGLLSLTSTAFSRRRTRSE
jgi:hypothetical protein